MDILCFLNTALQSAKMIQMFTMPWPLVFLHNLLFLLQFLFLFLFFSLAFILWPWCQCASWKGKTILFPSSKLALLAQSWGSHPCVFLCMSGVRKFSRSSVCSSSQWRVLALLSCHRELQSNQYHSTDLCKWTAKACCWYQTIQCKRTAKACCWY